MSSTSMLPRGGGRALRSFSADRSVTQHRLASGTLRRIAGFAVPYRRRIAVFLGLIMVDALVGASIPLLYARIIDDGIIGGHTDVVVGLTVVLGVLAVITAGLSLAQRWCSARIGEGLVHDLRTQVFDHVQSLPIAFFSRAQTGALVSRLNGDVQGAQQAFTSTLSNVVGNVVTLAATLTAMLLLSWQITLLALILLPAFVLPARWFGRRLADLTRERYTLNASMGHTMTERFNVSGALLVKVFGDAGRESRAFRDVAARVRDIGVRTSIYSRVLMISLTLLASLATAFVYGLGGSLAVSGAIGVGTVVALTAYLGRLYAPITALSNVQVDVMTTLVSFERVLEVLDLEPMVHDAADAVDLPSAAPATVELDDVTFGYPAAGDVSLASLESAAVLSTAPGGRVLNGVSLRAEPGEVVAVVGRSGAGKTTLTSLVSRLYDVTSGAVLVGGRDVRSVTQASLRRHIGVVSQDAHLFHDTLRANLAYANPDASDDVLLDACDAAQIGDLVRAMPEGLDTVVGDRGYRLSGGEKQRLAIARLLLKAPRIVVLDEATAHLDSTSEIAVQRALDAALTGRTALVVAHRLATVRAADRIVVLDRGRVAEQGTHDQLLALDGLYADLYRDQFASQEPLMAAAA